MAGRIDIDGVGEPHVYTGVPPFGVLFQSGALFSSLTLAENLALPLTTWTNVRGPLVQDFVRRSWIWSASARSRALSG
jgi:ABC-type transport system involved in resistance to organic solvents, ATPase component